MVPPKPPRFATARLLWRLGMVAIGIFLGSSLGGVLVPQKTAAPLEDLRPAISRLADPPGRPQTVLLLGLDGSQLKSQTPPAQVQLLLMARVHPGGGVEIIQIPTELSVLLPGQKQLKPISNLYGQGGVALVADVVAQLMANGGEPVPPDRYLLLSRGGLREVINRIGGLPFDIETPLRYQDKAGKLKIELDAGQQWLGGKELEQFLQFKGPDKGDGGRRQRQQRLLLPLADRLADAAVAPQLPALLSQMRAQLNTNLGHGELLSLLAAGLKDPDLIQLSRLPLSGDQAARRLDQIRAEPLLELWHQAQAPSANNPQVNVEGIEPISTNTAVERLQGAGLAAQASFLDAELMRPRTVILHGNGNNLKQAQAVRKALGLGELQRGPLSPGAGVQVLLGKDWQPSKP